MSEKDNKALSPAKADEKKAKKSAKPSFGARVSKWFRELRSETKKVTWPSRSQLTKNTSIVFAVVLSIGAFIWVLDFVLNFGVRFFTSLL